MQHNALLLLWPCIALVVTILAINRLCDALRDVFDPRTGGAPSRSALRMLFDNTIGVPGRATAPAPPPAEQTLLSVRDLRTHFATPDGVLRAVDGISFDVRRGETLAVVGESGSGKSITGLSILGLVPKPAGRIVGGEILFACRDGQRRDMTKLDDETLQKIRGNEIAMVFQEPMTSLNPVYRIGDQIAESVIRHRGSTRAQARQVALAALETVGIPDAARRIDDFPHQLSGGMRQRAMIAMALACEPSLLIADEPTTALDVTIQAQILDLMRKLKRETRGGMSILFITHNFGVVAEMADRVLVMYAGRIVEEGDVRTIFRAPRHPYTKGLLGSIPGAPGARDGNGLLRTIPGNVPSLRDLPKGCAFAPRCAWAEPACSAAEPALETIGEGHRTRCRRWSEL
jgi:oligopeptide/dipeptide ABC transporter ATP-binding protein